MLQNLLDILKPPKVIDVSAVDEKPDYSMAIVASVALVVVVVVIFLILKRK